MKWLPIAAALLAVPSLTLAQSKSPPEPEHLNSLKAGAWALQFDVNGELIDIDSFSGGLSLKRHFSPRSALRFGIGFSTTDHEQEFSQLDPAGNNSDDTREAQSVDVHVVYQRYMNPDAAVNTYWCLGPFTGLDRSEYESSVDSLRTVQKLTGWSVGLTAAFGAEWFFARQASLHVEYVATASYYQTDRDLERDDTGSPTQHFENDTDGWSFAELGAVRFGLSVFFGHERSQQ